MAARLSVARAARQLASSAPRRPTPFPQFSRPSTKIASLPSQQRLFSVSRPALEKQYTEDHEWIELSPDGKTCTLGISAYAARALGDVVYIELPTTGLEVSAGDAIGAVESVKSASDILTPIGGKVSEVNVSLEEKPGDINRDPEGEAWIARLEVNGEGVVGKTMGKEEYEKFTEDA
ncbi:hypothetical protein EJ04DRAFT_463634 [Polyplosphaeria fusca]|uniref:Glycine cleavage system H protein n=1 Tax=Polyplosphaeria fusca TaxID=682080 RepID=A0A9P4QY15_9PLEO|nr:hypothetical protein EJ04DRAFT_463634 [Polyplosphaeria fusca]